MDPALSVLTPQRIATEAFTDAAAAVVRLDEIYERNTHFLRDCFEAYVNGECSRRACAQPIPLCASRPRPMRGSIHASPTVSSQGRACTRPP